MVVARAGIETTGRQPDQASLEEIDRLCDESRFVTAYRRLGEFLPVEQWSDSFALVIASRLLHHVGAAEMSRRLGLLAYRRSPRSAEARFRVGLDRLAQRGPLDTAEWLGEYEPAESESPDAKAAVCWLRAIIATEFRDFDAAEGWLCRADTLTPGHAYTGVLRVGCLTVRDRYDEALELARNGLARHPRYRACVSSLADLLRMHGRFEEARELYADVAPKLESGALFLDLAGVEQQLRRYAESFAAITAAEELLPLADRSTKRRIAALRSDAAYFTSNAKLALEQAKLVDTPFHESLVTNLESTTAGKQVILDVPFVRQHHLTCVPATLSSLGRFWGRPVDHLELAERICYDGTRSHAGREWARQSGWVTREFTVTWESAQVLCERGVPFLVDTVHVTSAHAQAIVGCDAWRKTLFIRDPYIPALLETMAEPFFEQYRAHGPRGFAILPPERASLLADLELPDAELFNLVDALEAALEQHDRGRATEALQELRERAPGHRLEVLGRRALAAYDDNPSEMLATAEAALALYPGENTWLLTQLSALRQTRSSAVVRVELEALCAEDGTHPVFQEFLASELAEDARNLPRAIRMLREVARCLPERSQTLMALAQCRWRLREYSSSLNLFRLAACLDSTSESAARAYFQAALARGAADEALSHLSRRVDDFRTKAAGPSMTLFNALEQVERTRQAFGVLTMALEARPTDGQLLRFAAHAHGRYGEHQVAKERLDQAKAHVSAADWLRTQADLAMFQGDHALAIDAWRKVIELEPLATDAHAALARELRVTEGAVAARAHLAAATERFPQNAALAFLHVQWLSQEDPGQLVERLRTLLELEPTNAWARRELALALANLRRFPEAREQAEVALDVAPSEASGQLVLARIAEQEGKFVASREHYRRALELNIDEDMAVSELLQLTESNEERLQLLEEILERVAVESVSGDGVMAWFTGARVRMSAEELTRKLTSLRERRPDLWSPWPCSVQHLRGVDPEAAVEVAREATERFPLLPVVWLELARALTGREAESAARAAFERALAINPNYVPATLGLASLEENAGAEDRGLSVVERGLRHTPLDPTLLVTKAELLWRLSRRPEALATVKQAIEADPTSADAWERLQDWDRSDDFDGLGLVEQLAQSRPWDREVWMRLAEARSRRDLPGALEALERVTELDPSWVDAYDLRAVYATQLNQSSVALAACRPSHFVERVPVRLRGREAWVWATFGNLTRAVETMKQVVLDHPDYAWGHQQLADWAEALDDVDLELQAAEALAALHPNVAMAHGYLAAALEKKGKTKRARKAYARAISLSPAYRYAAFRLVQMAIDAGELEEAKRTIAEFVRHAEPAESALLRLQVALAEGDSAARDSLAEALFLDPEASPALLDAGRTALVQAEAPHARRLLWRLAQSPSAPGAVGAAWASSLLDSDYWPGAFALFRLRRTNPDAGEEALSVVLGKAGDNGNITALLSLLPWHWRFLRERDLLWGNVGYVLANADWELATIAWSRDYAERPAKPWMLYNLTLGLRAFYRCDAAAQVHVHALGLEPDHTSAFHATFLALEAELASEPQRAEALLADVIVDQLTPQVQHVHALVQALIALRVAPAEDRDLVAAEARNALSVVVGGPLKLLRLETQQWNRVAVHIGAITGSVADTLRGYSQYALFLGVWLLVAYLAVRSGGVLALYLVGAWVVASLVSRLRP